MGKLPGTRCATCKVCLGKLRTALHEGNSFSLSAELGFVASAGRSVRGSGFIPRISLGI